MFFLYVVIMVVELDGDVGVVLWHVSGIEKFRRVLPTDITRSNYICFTILSEFLKNYWYFQPMVVMTSA